MEFRHIFIKRRSLDYIYMNFLRPLGYLLTLYPIEKQKIAKNKKKYEYLKQYKNKHKGERCFIIGTGPSLKKEDLSKIKNEVLIGVNSLCLWKEFKQYLDYFFIGDIDAYRRLYVDLPDGTFVSSYCLSKCHEYDAHRFNPIPVCRYNYFVPYKKKISSDIAEEFYDFNSIVFLAIQFAMYAGFKEIYLLGVDCNYNTSKIYAIDHGIRHRTEYMQDVGLAMIDNFRFLRKFIEENKITIKIFNASSGGMLDVFERKNINNLIHIKTNNKKG